MFPFALKVLYATSSASPAELCRSLCYSSASLAHSLAVIPPLFLVKKNKVMESLDRLLRRDDKQLAAYRAACTLKTCPLNQSYYAYRPSLPTNSAFLALFSLSLCGYVLQAALSRRFIGFTAAMVSGCSLEVLGYIGRIMSWHNPFNQVYILFFPRYNQQGHLLKPMLKTRAHRPVSSCKSSA